jgi:N-acetylneuraminate synthase
MVNQSILIGHRPVGPGHPCLVIAEAGVNHNGDPELARQLVDAAADAGAESIKFQTFKADQLAAPQAEKADYQKETTGAGETQVEMLRRLELPEEGHTELQQRAQSRALLFLSSPFDEASADFLAELGVPAFKIASGEITNLPLLRHIAALRLPVILSTGMSTLGEVETALAALDGCKVVLLQCVSNYPARPADVNLLAMDTLRAAFGVPVGFSDHTLGTEVALAAVALGAAVIEKHLTLDRTLPGPDHRASIEPDEFSRMVGAIRNVEAALGDGLKRPVASEAAVAAVARKSLVAACDLPAGAALTAGSLAIRRPGTGLAPALLGDVVGRIARVAIPAGTPLRWEMIG